MHDFQLVRKIVVPHEQFIGRNVYTGTFEPSLSMTPRINLAVHWEKNASTARVLRFRIVEGQLEVERMGGVVQAYLQESEDRTLGSRPYRMESGDHVEYVEDDGTRHSLQWVDAGKERVKTGMQMGRWVEARLQSRRHTR